VLSRNRTMTLRELNARHSQPTAWTTARHSVIQLELWLVRRVRRRAGPFRYNFTSFDSITTRKWSRWIVIRAQTNQIRNDISTFSGGTTAGPTTRLAREGLRSPLPPPPLRSLLGGSHKSFQDCWVTDHALLMPT